MYKEDSNDLQTILSYAIASLEEKYGKSFDLDKVNLAELQRLTGISRGQLRHLKANGFVIKPHGRIGQHSQLTVLSGFYGILDSLLKEGITNSQVCFEKFCEVGYSGSHTQVKSYIREHKYLIPAKRTLVAVQERRGHRYQTAPAMLTRWTGDL